MDNFNKKLLKVNFENNLLKGEGSWRSLYSYLIKELSPKNLIEYGSGDPEFLKNIPDTIKRVAVDANKDLETLYKLNEIDFLAIDLENSDFISHENYEIAVCSDVFEHFLYPEKLLTTINDNLVYDGILISHVPNEFSIRSLLGICFNKKDSVVWHKGTKEWNNPHLRRFTDKGYQEFLSLKFAHNIRITDLKYTKVARYISLFGLPPYPLQPGPTYISTNCEKKAKIINKLKSKYVKENIRKN